MTIGGVLDCVTILDELLSFGGGVQFLIDSSLECLAKADIDFKFIGSFEV